MTGFICPVCGGALERADGCAKCPSGHCFDDSKRGYVNLLMSQRPGRGDDGIMVAARRRFLNAGYYLPLRGAISKILASSVPSGGRILDAGCGEGWYAEGFHEAVPNAEILCVDISKDAADKAARRSGLDVAVASVFRLPIADCSVDAVVSVFSPFCAEEFMRVLKPGGKAVAALPLPRHLFSLKREVYDRPYENDEVRPDSGGLTPLSETPLRFMMHLESAEDIKALFTMTPYYYKTAPDCRARLDNLSALDVEAEFLILTYERGADNA